MYQPREKVLWFAVISRLLVLVLQFLFNAICPDHNAGVFLTPRDPGEKTTIYDKLIDALLSGFTRWDAQYFLHIAKHGYTSDNTLAFFPLYPMAVRYSAIVLGRVFFMLNENSVLLMSATLVNFACFVKSAVVLYDLSRRVLKDNVLAYKAAILYCVNPASIFFSAFYSESMFAYMSFYSMLAYCENSSYIFLPIGMSALVRSNGLINVGFPVYACLKKVATTALSEYRAVPFRLSILHTCIRILAQSLWTLTVVLLSLFPFALLQVYNYLIFCTNESQRISSSQLSKPLKNTMAKSPPWCSTTIPVAYSYVQQQYWNVGFMRYYTFKQIPNFILAFPILYIMLKGGIEYLMELKHQLYVLGSRAGKTEQETSPIRKYPSEMFVFVVHGLCLTLFCICFVHIQVSTRLLGSASPLLYWYCARAMSYKPSPETGHLSDFEFKDNFYSKWKVFFLTQKLYSTNDVLILSYFLGYLVIGCFMFSNFLPWT